jgi:hypothetical protein
VRERRVLLALVGLLAIAGCTNSEAGRAVSGKTAGPPTEPTRTPSSSTAPTVPIPPRPAELKLAGVDACALFTNVQLAELKIDRTRKTTNGSQQYKGMAECVLNVEKQQPYYHYRVTAITNEGIGPWLTGKRNAEARLSTVASYPAATFWIRGANGHDTDGCTTTVDVAEGQQLMVDTDNDGAHSFDLEQLCQRAELAAGLAVQTLRTLK